MKNILFTLIVLSWISINVFGQGADFHLDKEYKIGKTGLLDMNVSDAKVFITGSDRSSAHVKIDRTITTKGWKFGEEQFTVNVEEESGDLKIREKHTSNNVGVVGYYNEEYKIQIELPEGASLTVRGDDGDYYIKNVNGSISLSLDDADAELADCKGSNFKFRIDDGDIRMNQGKGSLDVAGDDADVEINNAQFTSIHAKVDDGDLVIETSLSNSGEYFLEAQDGLVALNITSGGGNFNVRHDDAHVITEGEFKKTSDSEHETKLTLANGSAKVNVRADDARVKLTARRD